MVHVRCKNCNKELISTSNQTKCCGCENITTVAGDKITAVDLSLVILIDSNNKKEAKNVLSTEDLQYQEARRTRKVRKLDFEIR